MDTTTANEKEIDAEEIIEELNTVIDDIEMGAGERSSTEEIAKSLRKIASTIDGYMWDDEEYVILEEEEEEATKDIVEVGCSE
jgi:hypothetical protein